MDNNTLIKYINAGVRPVKHQPTRGDKFLTFREASEHNGVIGIDTKANEIYLTNGEIISGVLVERRIK